MDIFFSDIDEIVVIYWKGTEAKFQDLLQRRLSDKKITITTVTGTDDTVRKEFSRFIPNAVYRESVTTFSDFIKQSILDNRPLFNNQK